MANKEYPFNSNEQNREIFRERNCFYYFTGLCIERKENISYRRLS